MKIVVIPETDEEKARFTIAEHENVSEFFLFGNKITPEGNVSDFHDWRGSYRYLIGSLSWFEEEIKEGKRRDVSRAEAARSSTQQVRSQPNLGAPAPVSPMVQQPVQSAPPVEPVIMAQPETTDVEAEIVEDKKTKKDK